MKSYLLNHIQGFQKCKSYQNIPTGSCWIDPQKCRYQHDHEYLCVLTKRSILSKVNFHGWLRIYDLVNKISFLEQSEHFHFWCLLLAYYRLLAIVNALRFWPKFFRKIMHLMQSEFIVVYLDFWVWDISTILWDTL